MELNNRQLVTERMTARKWKIFKDSISATLAIEQCEKKIAELKEIIELLRFRENLFVKIDERVMSLKAQNDILRKENNSLKDLIKEYQELGLEGLSRKIHEKNKKINDLEHKVGKLNKNYDELFYKYVNKL